MSKKIGFIGLGHMGGPMAANLATAGHIVTGFDLMPEALAAARANGLLIAGNMTEAVASADIVITMLPAGRHVLGAYDGPDGLIAAAAPDAILVDCSTIEVADSQAAHRLAAAGGHRSVDAPVSGGATGAAAGTLTFMVGANSADFEAVKPVLENMGAKIVHCGGPGTGQAAKICNNMILGVTMIAVSEAFVLGEKLGLDHQALYDVVSESSGQCWALTTNCPVPLSVPASPANRGYEPGFAAALMSKDLGLALNALESTGVDGKLGEAAARIFQQYAHEEGGAAQDFSGIINAIRSKSNAKVPA